MSAPTTTAAAADVLPLRPPPEFAETTSWHWLQNRSGRLKPYLWLPEGGAGIWITVYEGPADVTGFKYHSRLPPAASTAPTAPASTYPIGGQIDPGIIHAVTVLQANAVETFESCEGGAGHAFPEPTIRFHGAAEAGFRALAVCIANGLPVLALRRVWYLEGLEPTGPQWELTFRHKMGAA